MMIEDIYGEYLMAMVTDEAHVGVRWGMKGSLGMI